MANNTGTLVISPVRPQDEADDFPTAYASEILGGLHSVADTTARDAISEERRVEGMMCYVISETKNYQLQGGIENTDWVEFSAGVTELEATGTIDGSNTTFTFIEKPDYIYSDGVKYKENAGWTWDTLTATLSVPPQFSIWGEK